MPTDVSFGRDFCTSSWHSTSKGPDDCVIIGGACLCFNCLADILYHLDPEVDIWETGRETSHDFDPNNVLAEIGTLRALIEEGSPPDLDHDAEADDILCRWSGIRLSTDGRLFRVPAALKQIHDRFWEPVREGKMDVARLLQEGNKELALLELTKLEASVRKLLAILEP